MNQVIHQIDPVCNEKSRILILGTFPSIKSREGGFYYHHPQNRFWKVLADLVQESAPPFSIHEKKAFLLRNHIAVWDVIRSCDIVGSSDSSIRNVIPNDLNQILSHVPIRAIFANGNKAHELYKKYCMKETGRAAIKLPSTSPANAAFSLEKLTVCWQLVHEALTHP